MSKTLFFFTSSYPFGTGETFIENEIVYLSKAFERVVIVSNDIRSEQTREVPLNVMLERVPYQLSFWNKIHSYLQILNPIFWEEYRVLRNVYRKRITKPILNTMLQTLQKAKTYNPIIKKLIRTYTKESDQIYLYSYWNNDVAFVCAYFKQANKRIKAFARMHRWDVYFEESTIDYLPFRKYIFEELDKVYSISEDGIQYSNKLLNKNFNKISLSRLGVRTQNKINQIGGKPIQLLSISNLIPVKAVYLIIEACSLLNIEFKWIHIGDGFLRRELEKLALNKIPGRYDFKGARKNKEVLEYFTKEPVDIFINVSQSEGIPVSIMEAMSFGIPCIATAVGGTSEIVNKENGILLSSNPSPEDIAGAILHFHNLRDDAKKEKRKMANNTWKEKYNAEKNYSNFINDIYSL